MAQALEQPSPGNILDVGDVLTLIDDVYYCGPCKIQIEAESDFRSHLESHAYDCLYHCLYCPALSSDTSSIAEHIEDGHPSKENFYGCLVSPSVDQILETLHNEKKYVQEKASEKSNSVSSNNVSYVDINGDEPLEEDDNVGDRIERKRGSHVKVNRNETGFKRTMERSGSEQKSSEIQVEGNSDKQVKRRKSGAFSSKELLKEQSTDSTTKSSLLPQSDSQPTNTSKDLDSSSSIVNAPAKENESSPPTRNKSADNTSKNSTKDTKENTRKDNSVSAMSESVSPNITKPNNSSKDSEISQKSSNSPLPLREKSVIKCYHDAKANSGGNSPHLSHTVVDVTRTQSDIEDEGTEPLDVINEDGASNGSGTGKEQNEAPSALEQSDSESAEHSQQHSDAGYSASATGSSESNDKNNQNSITDVIAMIQGLNEKPSASDASFSDSPPKKKNMENEEQKRHVSKDEKPTSEVENLSEGMFIITNVVSEAPDIIDGDTKENPPETDVTQGLVEEKTRKDRRGINI